MSWMLWKRRRIHSVVSKGIIQKKEEIHLLLTCSTCLMSKMFQPMQMLLKLIWIDLLIWLKNPPKNTVISPDFLVWKFYGKTQFPHGFRRIANCFTYHFRELFQRPHFKVVLSTKERYRLKRYKDNVDLSTISRRYFDVLIIMLFCQQ